MTIGNVPINVMVLTVVALLNNTQACVFVIHYISGVILISGAIPLDYCLVGQIYKSEKLNNKQLHFC